MFTAPSFLAAENWNETICPSTGEWVNKLAQSWYGTHLSNENRQTIDKHSNLVVSEGNYVE
jgi:hypothetical protein